MSGEKKYTDADLEKSYNEGLNKGKKEGFEFAGGKETTSAINFQEEYIKKYDISLQQVGDTFTNVIKAAGGRHEVGIGIAQGGAIGAGDAVHISGFRVAREVANRV